MNATLDNLDEQQIEKIINYLRQISGDAALTLKKVEPGSIKLILEGSPEGFERVNSLVESGELTEVLGIEVNKDASVIGERKEVTILFSDIRDFTSIFEKLESAEVVSLLNNYFETMVEAVFNHEGTLDKFIGDAVMVIFGAHLPLENHAWLAIQCALDMCDRLAELNKHNHNVNLPTIRIGIGISSGEIAVIDPGSPRLMDYTIIGDSLHTSSRLKQMTQKYGCNIILSEFTYKMCQEKIWARELDRIRGKGRNDPFTIYELLGNRSIPLNTSTEQFLNLYQIGRSAYMAMDFRKAIQYFEAAKKLKEDDRAVEIHLERANAYLLNPPSTPFPLKD